MMTDIKETARKLQFVWDEPKTSSKDCEYLKSIEITSSSGLRGIKKAKLEFSFPVAVICGPNKTGKSTFLQLAILAFHGIIGNREIRSGQKKTPYYQFKHFFSPISSLGEEPPSDIEIKYSYINTLPNREKLLVNKKEGRWMNYVRKDNKTGEEKKRRIVKKVEIIGLSRIVAVYEQAKFLSKFGTISKKTPDKNLKSYLAYIMGVPYKEISSTTSEDSSQLNDYDDYSSANAGAGEECLLKILNILNLADDYSLVAIEEIEVGLHSTILKRLADKIFEIALKKKLQIIISTHSPEFIKACPRASLILAERDNDNNEINFLNNCPNELAIEGVHRNSGNFKFFIICEDEVAKSFIDAIIIQKYKPIVKIIKGGGNKELIKLKEKFKKSPLKAFLFLIVFDEKTPEIENLIQKDIDENKETDDECEYQFLGDAPEKIVINNFKSIQKKLQEQYSINGAVFSRIHDAIRAIKTDDIHNIFYVIAENIYNEGKPVLEEKANAIRSNIVKWIVDKKPKMFKDLKKTIEDLINN